MRLGHDAISCDLQPTLSPGPHFQCDVMDVIDDGWDLGIFFPECTYLTCSAEWAYGDGPYHQKVKPGTLVGEARREARERAIEFARKLMAAPKVKKKGMENPVGVLSTRYRRPDQIIQPYEFGDDASKKTCLWLDGLGTLVRGKYIQPRMVNGKPRWENQTDSGQNRISPSDDRAMLRGLTYPGVAEAFAAQWSDA